MRQFKNIIATILVGISILFVFNLFFLRGLFASITEETERTVRACIEYADGKEIQLRLEKLSHQTKGRRTISVEKNIVDDSVATRRNMIGEQIQLTQERRESLSNQFPLLEKLVTEIKTTIHQNIDSILPVNLDVLDSLLNVELKNRKVPATIYHSEIFDVNTQTVVRTSCRNGRHKLSGSNMVLYLFDSEHGYAYRIIMPALTGIVLRQMSGILLSTFLIILLLCLAFWYLIQTVMQQKTLEELKDDFTNNMTHELKTPIAVAYSAADSLLNFRLGEDRMKREKYLRICLEQLTRLSGLVEQILSMSIENRKSFTVNKESLSIARLIDQQENVHRLKTNKPITFRTMIEPQDLTFYADSVHLGNIISNLIDNAVKYSSEEVVIELSAYREDGYDVLEVRDYGVGIGAEHVDRIFDKFYRVPKGNHHNVKGYGLGLFYVRQMVAMHGGSVFVRSRLNRGTVFTVKIPKA